MGATGSPKVVVYGMKDRSYWAGGGDGRGDGYF